MIAVVTLDATDAYKLGQTLRGWANALRDRSPDEELPELLLRVGNQMVAASRAAQEEVSRAVD